MIANFFRKIRVALSPRTAVLETTLENGAKVAGINSAGFGGRGVYIFRDALEPELAALAHFVKPGDVFVDIGANVGVFSMKAAKEIGPDGVVLAIEPFVGSAFQISKNIEANRFTNVRLRNLCVGRETAQARFFLNNASPNSFGLHQQNNAASISVLCVALDDLIEWEKLERLDYLKIDAEGAEAEILAGARKTIERFQPLIQVEITLGGSRPPGEYLCFVAPGSPNCLFIPAAKQSHVAVAQSLGWELKED